MMAKLIDKLKRVYGKIVNFPICIYKRIKFGKNVVVYGTLRIYGKKDRIIFGDNCIIRSGISTNPLGGEHMLCSM